MTPTFKLPKKLSSLLILLISALLPASSIAQVFADSNEDEFLRVEEAFQVLVEVDDDSVNMSWTLAPDYYLYQHQFKAEAYNTRERTKLKLDFAPGKRKYDEYFDKELEVYYFNTLVTAALPSIEPPYELKVVSQGCAEAGLCYPPRKQYFQVAADGSVFETDSTQITSDAAAAVNTAKTAQQDFANEEKPPFLPSILFFALIGGLILNLMPCVFPVLSLKALSFASSNQPGHKQHMHGWAYTAGVIASFLVAAAFLLVARQAGEMLGWGFQLQQPVFVALLAYLFLLMGLSLYGMFSIGTQFMGAGQELTAGSGLKASFFTGVLAAVVASPCTAPLMAPALGAAMTQPPAIAIIVFIVLGFGMALPFLALSYSPKLAEFLPKPGAWMEVLKQVLAFPLFATSIWLLWVLGHQTGSSGIAYVLSAALLICFTIWLAKFTPAKQGAKIALRVLMIASLLAAAHLTWDIRHFNGSSAGSEEQWEAYTPERLQQLREEGKPVFINLTADWCITCKVNEQLAFSSETFFTRAEELGVTLLVGDWTNPDENISMLLKRYKRSGVPLYLVFPANINGEPEILPQLLSTTIIVEAMERAVE
ncbi:Thiol:disulfide interchange protein DsbD [Alteromonadaceae bacterium Bs31]|nr:Thiol:disulfide interchange protein DsbD [Alteromonadaceae bacterium Bs31]